MVRADGAYCMRVERGRRAQRGAEPRTGATSGTAVQRVVGACAVMRPRPAVWPLGGCERACADTSSVHVYRGVGLYCTGTACTWL